MSELALLFTKSVAIFTLLGNLFSVGVLLAYLFRRSLYLAIMQLLGQNALSFGLFLSTAATLGSLVYSEVLGFAACILCWIQRIFMYPLMFLFAQAFARKERVIFPYALLLALTGGAVALYNWLRDMFALYSDISLGCPVVPGLPSCDRIYVLEYGYITIPMISLNAFILIALVLYAGIKHGGQKN